MDINIVYQKKGITLHKHYICFFTRPFFICTAWDCLCWQLERPECLLVILIFSVLAQKNLLVSSNKLFACAG